MRPGPSPWVFPSSTAICRGAASPVAPCMRWCPKLKAQRRPPSASSRRCLFAYRPLPSLPLPLVGRGQGWGSGGQAQVSTPLCNLTTPLPPSPTRGEGKREATPLLRHAALRARPPRPAAWSRPRRSRSRSGAPDPGRDRASARHAVGHGGGAAFARPASRRRNDRQARTEIEPKAAARRGGCGAAAPAAAAGVDAGIERGGNALAHRHGQGRARPFRSDRAGALASHT